MSTALQLRPVPEGYWIRYHHLHKKDDLAEFAKDYGLPSAKPPKYVTVAEIRKDDTNELAAIAIACCSPRDCPSRKLGRAIAHNRAVLVVRQQLKQQEAPSQ